MKKGAGNNEANRTGPTDPTTRVTRTSECHYKNLAAKSCINIRLNVT